MPRPSRSSLRPLALALWLAASACARAADAAAAAPPADPPPRPVVDPYYGEVLFEFFQGKYFPALTELEASQQFERMPHHADEAEVLRGGMLLSYGLHEQASAVFESLIAHGAADSVRDRAWYFLAKIRYQRGLYAPAAQAIARIEHPLAPPLQEDRVLLQANVLLALGDNAGAAQALAPLTGKRGEDLYAKYNLGVALVRSGDEARGSAVLDEIGRMVMGDEERRALRDKANVALGFAALKAGNPQRAREVLQRVRLQGIEADQALLGFGWAADAMGDPKQALVPWLELAGRDPTDASVLEAQLAVPYAYTELGANAQALERYQVAIHNYEIENANLDATISAIREGRLAQGLMARNPGDQMGWFQNFRDVPLLPHARHLVPVIAGNAFQEALKNYRDLLFVGHNLADWRDNLGVYDDMLANRRQAFAERLPEVLGQHGAGELDRLQQRTEADAAALKQADGDADGRAFADAGERALQARLARVQATLDALPADTPDADGSIAEARERLRRVQGALAWRLSQEFPARAHGANTAQAQTEAGLAQARARAAELAQAQTDEPARFEAFAARIAALQGRLDALQPRVAALTREQQAQLGEIAVAGLLQQKAALAGYIAQARLAVAQLYDRATESTEGAHAKP